MRESFERLNELRMTEPQLIPLIDGFMEVAADELCRVLKGETFKRLRGDEMERNLLIRELISQFTGGYKLANFFRPTSKVTKIKARRQPRKK